MRRLLLVRHAPTSATRAAAFPADEGLDERGRQAAAELAASWPRRSRWSRARRSAVARPPRPPGSRRCSGRAHRRVRLRSRGPAARSPMSTPSSPTAVQSWMLDPGAAPHGGESLAVFSTRIARWLDAQAEADGRLAAVTHGEVIKAAVVHALGAPLQAFWRIDATPLAVTELHAHGGRWTVVRLNCAAGSLSSRRRRVRAPRPPRRRARAPRRRARRGAARRRRAARPAPRARCARGGTGDRP